MFFVAWVRADDCHYLVEVEHMFWPLERVVGGGSLILFHVSYGVDQFLEAGGGNVGADVAGVHGFGPEGDEELGAGIVIQERLEGGLETVFEGLEGRKVLGKVEG